MDEALILSYIEMPAFLGIQHHLTELPHHNNRVLFCNSSKHFKCLISDIDSFRYNGIYCDASNAVRIDRYRATQESLPTKKTLFRTPLDRSLLRRQIKSLNSPYSSIWFTSKFCGSFNRYPTISTAIRMQFALPISALATSRLRISTNSGGCNWRDPAPTMKL